MGKNLRNPWTNCHPTNSTAQAGFFTATVTPSADILAHAPSGGLQYVWELVGTSTNSAVFASSGTSVATTTVQSVTVKAGHMPSLFHRQHTLTVSLKDNAPISVSASTNFTVWSKQAEPISLPPVTHCLAQFPINSNVTYSVDTPGMWLADSNFVWSSVGGISFVNNVNTGRTVTVKGNSTGDAKLTVKIADYPGTPPEFNVKVTDKVPTYATVYIVCDAFGNKSVTETFVSNRFNEAYTQVGQMGMDLRIASIQYVTNSAWFNIANSALAHHEMGTVSNAVSGLKVFFVNQLEGGAYGFNGSNAIAIASTAIPTTLAHEIGHACGLPDIYPYVRNNLGVTIATVTGFVSSSRMDALDWGAGCYASDLTQSNLIWRVLMCGYGNDLRGHMPHGKVFGLASGATVPGMISVGLKDMTTRQPVHLIRP